MDNSRYQVLHVWPRKSTRYIIDEQTVEGITVVDLWVMVVFATCILPLLYTEMKLQRWEGGLLLAGYAAYLWVLWPLRTYISHETDVIF